MKDKLLPVFKMLGWFLFALALSYSILIIIDTQYDHMVADWFEKRFTELYNYGAYGGPPFLIPRINWEAFKSFGLEVCGIVIVVFLSAIYLTIYFTQKRAETKALHKAALYMKEYLDSESDPVPSKKYQELMSGVADFKSRMRHNERILQDETSKKNDLIAYLAHDLKTPLTSVVGYLSLLEEAPDMPTAQKARYTHIALQKAERLEQLINEFFEITRYNLHEIVLEKETIDLNYMLIQMADEFYPVLKAHGNEVKVQAQEHLQLYADAIKIARVFQNILKNAIAYSEAGSTIEITARKEDTQIHLYFSNRGKTIPPQKLRNIFQKFYRLDEARSTNNGGAGLGLAIAKEIVRLHGGEISASSEKGTTTFHVILPDSTP